MSKKDYVAIGGALRLAAGFVNPGEVNLTDRGKGFFDGIRSAATKVADVFERDNPKFDRARFLRYVETGIDSPIARAA